MEYLMEATILFVAVAALILLAVTSMRFGVDSRDSFASKERELAAHGIPWGGSVATQKRPMAPVKRMTMNLPRQGQEQEPTKPCIPAPCSA
jgi:hypothetical protein